MLFLQIDLDGIHHAACLGKAVCLARGVEDDRVRLRRLDINAHAGEDGSYFLESQGVIDFRVILHFLPLRHAGTDKDNLGVGVLLLHDSSCVIHRRTRARDVFCHIGNMLFHQLDVRRAAAGRHERLTLGEFFLQLFGFVAGRAHRTLRHLNHILEAHLLQSAIYAFDGSPELSQNRGGDDGDNLLAATDSLQDIENLRHLEDSAEGTSVHAFATVDTLGFVDMLDAILILADGLDGTYFFARDGDINNRVVGAALVAFATADTSIMVDFRLPVLLEVDSILRAIHIATPRNTTATEVRNLVVHRDTGRARLIDDTHDVVFLRSLPS